MRKYIKKYKWYEEYIKIPRHEEYIKIQWYEEYIKIQGHEEYIKIQWAEEYIDIQGHEEYIKVQAYELYIKLQGYEEYIEIQGHEEFMKIERYEEYIKQQIIKCMLCRVKDETVNHIISKYSKFKLKKYKTEHDWVGRVINWELCKRLKFDHTTKWYIHKPESV